MGIQLNHTIVWCADRRRSARFMADILGRPAPSSFGHFEVVSLDNGVALDYADLAGPIQQQHYAFLVGDDEFDAIFARIRDRGIRYWADPMRTRPDAINRDDGGRGVYFADPNDHLLELITRPYGG